ncbi:hypothetical protein AJ80_06842 [Polytolypa hystricis UAMH7299]|uniref:N-acetylglucosamine-induced protein 1 n=1 Tax=Polytolypa hystricis (strain UAMH7299) TaxID=1447883 RepID=A0A2B7XTL8_POLH7|nr:hypothetical protein AJ80_06842 [Polytolypa hystricis UAMH7299]
MPAVPNGFDKNAATPFSLTEVDRQVLAQTDDEFIYHDWDNLKTVIANNELAGLKRKPSDLIRYITWTTKIKAKYGSITNYINQERLHWQLDPPADPGTLCKNPVPFADSRDYKILRNDWPYGMTPDITHIVVWLKNRIPVKPGDGDVTDESRALIEKFVNETFVARLESVFPDGNDARDRVLWFKNWVSLQSVRSLEHIHVLVRDVPDEIVTEWTGEAAKTKEEIDKQCED